MLDGNIITAEEYLGMKPEISAQVLSLSILLDNLLKWGSGYIKGQTKAKPVNTDLSTIVKENFKLLQSAADSKQITLENEIPDTLIAYCDAEQMDIVIRNLTVNAIKFSNHNGVVTLSAKSDDSNIYLSVTDHGVGMTQQQIDKLFQIADDNHTYGTDGETGTGLGLLLCYEFARANDGTITVVSEKGKGSTFTVTLKKASLLPRPANGRD
jgi:signal transduction histidine kinase